MNAAGPELFVTLFDRLSRHNFPPGRFERRAVSASVAKQRIDQARAHGRLCCISDRYLAIDKRAMHRSRELLETLASLPERIHLTIEDFVRRRCFTPLEAAAVGPDVDLLVVSCMYRVPGVSPGVQLVIDNTSVSFDLFSSLRAEQ
jgi:hypothetical protein